MARDSIRIEGLAGVLDVLKLLPPELVSKAGGPVKIGLRDAALLLRDEAKVNVRRIIDAPNEGGEASKSTGLLLLSIVAGRSRPAPGVKGERFAVRIRANQRYPANRQDSAGSLTAAQIGRQLEYGTERRAPMAWMRPAFDAKKEAAVQVFTTTVRTRLDAIVKKLERQARRK